MWASAIREDLCGGTIQRWYVVGNTAAPAIERWCTTTRTETADLQANDVLTQLGATGGPILHDYILSETGQLILLESGDGFQLHE
jgi:hypothetical protein